MQFLHLFEVLTYIQGDYLTRGHRGKDIKSKMRCWKQNMSKTIDVIKKHFKDETDKAENTGIIMAA